MNDPLASIRELFTFSPFGLHCRQCEKGLPIQLDERCIRRHLKTHGMDSRVATVHSLFKEYKSQVENVRAVGTIEPYRSDQQIYSGFLCACGQSFLKKANAIRHSQNLLCDVSKLQAVDLVKLCCGRYVSQAQVSSFFHEAPRITQQFNYSQARAVLLPFLPKKEKQDHTYTHMYVPLISGCGGAIGFTEKIKADFVSIHSSPCQSVESMLITIQKQAESWLLNFAQKNILMVPGNLRAGLQTLQAGEVDDVSQGKTYRMQHDPTSLLSELKKLLSFAYRRGLFASKGFDDHDDFAVAYFLKDLLLEVPPSVAFHPFAVEFCLMFPFRVRHDGSQISMISCDTVSSLFSKVSSLLKAAVCSVICSFSKNTYTVMGNLLVESVRKAPVIHILSPMVRQVKEMYNRLPKRQKTILHPDGNIIVDQYSFSFDIWSQFVPLTVSRLRETLTHLAIGEWWEPVVDPATIIKVRVEDITADISLVGVTPLWNQGACLSLDQLDNFTALLKMAFHGFGGGSARETELAEPNMFHCLYCNDTVYYSMTSLKGYTSSSRHRFLKVERKLPSVIARYYILYGSLVKSNVTLFTATGTSLMFPTRVTSSCVGIPNVIRNIFDLDSLPNMRQVRQLWAGVSNMVTGDHGNRNNFLRASASSVGASKFGHSAKTHENVYSSERFGGAEAHFNSYHFAIGDTSYEMSHLQSTTISLGDIRAAMSLRYPKSISSSDGHLYLTVKQKALVEFGYGHQSPGKHQHCFGLLAPGEGKSECYIIPSIARRLGNQRPRMIIHVSPYNFLAAYQFKNATVAIKNVGFASSIPTCLLTGHDINVGLLPEELSSVDHLPSLLFLNLDALYNLFTFHFETFKSWAAEIDKIVIDEIHTVLTELCFREKYQVYWRLPALGIPIVALSGSLPIFVLPKLAKRLCLSVSKDMIDINVIHGGDIVGNFPKGFRIKFSISANYVEKVASFVVHRLGAQPVVGAAHVFVTDKKDGKHLLRLLESRAYKCMFISSDTCPMELELAASQWGEGKLDVLISTSIALVGNENPLCRFVACAGYLFDAMQVVQAFGRLRQYMRSSSGQILFVAPNALPEYRIKDDEHRFTRLLNENLLSHQDLAIFRATMTSNGVRDWIMNGVARDKDCALKILSQSFGKLRDGCGACPFCLSSPTRSVQTEAINRMLIEKNNEKSTERVLQKLALKCLVCHKTTCRGIPLLKGKGSKSLPENKDCCFSWRNCYQCGVSQHDRSHCFDKTYLNNIACCECWVYKKVPGATHHQTTDCEIKGRLRRLLSYNFTSFKVKGTFKEYIEGIYTSSASFCQFMSSVEVKFMQTQIN